MMVALPPPPQQPSCIPCAIPTEAAAPAATTERAPTAIGFEVQSDSPTDTAAAADVVRHDDGVVRINTVGSHDE